MSVQRIALPITTDAAGAGTATSPAPVNGWVLEVRVASGVLTVGGSADFTVTRATDGGTVLAVSNAAAPFSYQPRPAQHTTAGGTTSYAAGIGPVLDPRGVAADDYLTVVVAQGALSASGTVYVHVEGRGGA